MSWVQVCRLDDLVAERPVAALVGEDQVALVRLVDGAVHAVGHRDPVTGANVMARGVVGSRTVADEQVPTIASPIYKEVYDLRTGRGLGEPGADLGSYPVKVVDGLVLVGPRAAAGSAEGER